MVSLLWQSYDWKDGLYIETKTTRWNYRFCWWNWNISREISLYHSCWCTSSNGCYHIRLMCSYLPWGRIQTAGTISMLRNGSTWKYVSMFLEKSTTWQIIVVIFIMEFLLFTGEKLRPDIFYRFFLASVASILQTVTTSPPAQLWPSPSWTSTETHSTTPTLTSLTQIASLLRPPMDAILTPSSPSALDRETVLVRFGMDFFYLS